MIPRIRFALLALCMTLFASAAAQVKDENDRFTGARKISYSSPTAPLGQTTFNVDVSVSKSVPVVLFTFITANLSSRGGSSWKYVRCHQMAWLVDGRPFAMDAQATHQGTVVRGGVIEMVSQFVTADQLHQLAAASQVEYRICQDEGALDPAAMSALREISQKLKPAVAPAAEVSLISEART